VNSGRSRARRLASALAGGARRLGWPLAILGLLLAAYPQTRSAPATLPIACTLSAVACENQLPGNPSGEWDFPGVGSTMINGFSTDISVNVGGTVRFKIDQEAPVSPYTIDIYRMGYYQGNGARKVTSVVPSSPPKNQIDCLVQASVGLVDCGNWTESASWAVPASAVSGVYFAKIRRNDNGEANHIFFIVRNDASHADIVFQTSDTTWQAYNKYGGSNFYAGPPNGRAYKLSYNRPITTRGDVINGQDWVFANEYPMIRWLERNGYDMSYQSGVDTDRLGSLLTNHKVFLSVGHDEYWSGQQRANVEAARDAGVSLGFFGGNDVYWKTRYETSIDGTNNPYRTLVTYKETRDDATVPTNSSVWTGTWRDPRFTPPFEGGGRPENALTGTMYTANCCNAPIEVPEADGKMRIWRNTSVASLAGGTKATLADATMGYEYNEAVDNGFQPPGLIRMSTTTQATPEYLVDHGLTVTDGIATHNITLYKAPSGALVFSAGTVQWSWGLDSNHDGPVNPPEDSRMQQATLNLFADMGVQPTTKQANLAAATKSTDTTRPTSTITAPAAGATLTGESTVTISGTAADVGGRVGGVEVSTDDGATWHPAQGRTNWTYSWRVHGFGPTVIKVRATDDSANLQTATTSRTVNVTCPCTGFGGTKPLIQRAHNDASAVSVGVRFQADVAATVTGVRFYKFAPNTGTHTGSLWSTTGTRLATGTFTNESGTGWQTLTFPAPVAIEANTTYIASYYAPVGRYSVDMNYFLNKGVDRAPVHLLQDGLDGPSGVWGAGDNFPGNPGAAASYAVDVIVQATYGPDVTPPQATPRNPGAGATIAPINTNVQARFSEPVQPATINVTLTRPGGSVTGTQAYDATSRTVTFTPSANLAHNTTYTATVSGARDTAGNTMVSTSWTFTTALAPRPPGVCPCSVFAETAVPSIVDAGDATGVEVGMRFRADTVGQVTAIRFYKAVSNTGTHTGNLWDNAGNRLATVTFPGESATGWQQANLSTPVTLQAGTTYVVSYHAPGGHYSSNPGQFNGPVDNAPLHGLSNGADGSNSVFSYSATSVFPTSTWGAANYWVDVLFSVLPDTTPPTIATSSPSPSTPAAPVASPVTVKFSEPLQAGTPVVTLSGPGGAVSGTPTYPDNRTVTFTPGTLAYNTTYTVNVSGARDTANNLMAPVSWTFKTELAPRAPGVCPCSVFVQTDVPYQPDHNDPAAVELGMRFRSDTSGTVSGVRFYKGAGNTGTHVGSLWTTSGTKLASVTFTGETTTGWQQANFATPVTIAAGQTYVVSYFAPNGHYATNPNQFSSAVDRGPLHGLANGFDGPNGVFRYGATGGFPDSTWQATNYWVDVVFQPTPDTAPPTVAAKSPPAGSNTAPTNTPVHATFSEEVQPATVVIGLSGPGGAVTGSTTFDAPTNTAIFTPGASLAASTTYTVSVSGTRDIAGNQMAPTSWTFTTATPPPPGSCPCSIFPASATPATAASGDTSSVEVGTRFRTDVNGTITGIRFYKGPGNTGTHTGSLWSSTGTRLATVTFTNELATGWQQALFSTPVAVTPGQSYVASYLAPNGRYSVTPGQFATAVDNGNLHTLADGDGGGNGIYTYGAAGGFPTSSWGATNYWVDVLFLPSPDTTAPTVTAVTPPAGASSQPLVTNTLRATFSEPVQAGTIAFGLAGPGGAVSGTTTYDAATRTATLTLSGPLPAAATLAATVSGARDGAGNLMASHQWSFRSAGSCPCSAFASDATPVTTSDPDTGPLTLGMRFTPSTNGTVTAIRFYKGAGNTGTHVGALWSAAGANLASVTFTGESGSGWQTASLTTPVAVTAGTEYVVSYFAPNGHYAGDGGFFAQPWVNGPLQGHSGRYVYGGAGAFPANTSSANYWVDVVFSPGS
jgi:hypothetical protein